MSKKIIITVDGPAGSGKSTVAKHIAKKLNMKFLSSGKIYRTFAYLETQYGYDEAQKLIKEIKINEGNIIFRNQNLDSIISSEKMGQKASELSRKKEVREIVNRIQRDVVYGTPEDFVVEGRDEGTEVFPEADLKIFLDASPEERAKRKYLEQKEKDINYFIQKIKERDNMDSTREISPLKVPEGAIVIDTTSKTVEEVVQEIIKEIKKIPDLSIKIQQV
ncbi:MAG: (d)CMP kinase [Candidatus Calescibacterium sp.]|nr:(d)CMP kinase [Candidatus Calescibacterium sp.]MCX7734925.1 (d)CMP kinase [bacterium]MDW8087778.1 (d)CMP kinase [Candidatus Calescibacterium sp.]